MDSYQEELIEKLKNTRMYSNGKECLLDVRSVVDFFTTIKKNNGKVFFIGNGGSAAIAMHMTADYMKNGGMRTCSLYDSSVVTCLGNDYGYEEIFSRQLSFLSTRGDLLVAISSSGKSENIINAVKTAKNNGANICTLTGFEENNPVKKMGDISIYVPSDKYGIVESVHNVILQQIVDIIMERDGACL